MIGEDEEWNEVTTGRRIRDNWQKYRTAVVGVSAAVFMLVVLMTVTGQPARLSNLGTRNWLTSMWKVTHEENEKHGDEKNKSFTDDEVAAATARAQRLLRTLEHSPIARARLSQRALCPGFLDAVRAALHAARSATQRMTGLPGFVASLNG